MSVEMQELRKMMEKMSAGMFNSDQMDVGKVRAVLKESYANQPKIPGVTMELGVCKGVEIATYIPDKCISDNIVYYLHGGGLVTGDRLTAGSYSAQLALVTGCRVVACSYRLAPENPFPAGFDDSCNVYMGLLEVWPESKIALIGESGGAYLSLAVALWAREQSIRQPSAVVMNSIVADLTGQIKRVDTPEETTVSVSGLAQLAEMYGAGQDITNPYISLICADYAGLPPMRLVYDRDEVLAVDSIEVAKKAREAGVEVELKEYIGCFHAFTTTGMGTPESKEELFASAEFIKKYFI